MFHPTQGLTTVHCPKTHRMWVKHTQGGNLWTGTHQEDMFYSSQSVAGTMVCSHPYKLWDLGRYLTARETARMQGFPETFTLPTHRYHRLFGNAVAIPCAQFACSRVVDADHDGHAVLRHVDLCAGIGGFGIALRQLLGEHRVCCAGFSEVYEPAIECFLSNFPEACALGDAVAVERWPQCDILTAGFPCQPFSKALSTHTNESHPKYNFLEVVLCAIERSGAQRVVLENVPTLRTIGVECYDRILGRLEDLGFVVETGVLNAHHFGLPQERKRLYIVGRRGGQVPLPFSTTDEVRDAALSSSTIADILQDTHIQPLKSPSVGPPFRRPVGRSKRGCVWDVSTGMWTPMAI